MQSLNRVCSGVMAIALMSVATSAFAQEQKPDPVELSPTQIETNNRAVRMLGESPPKTKEAIKLVEAALLMDGKGDLLYLTLGRAYQLDGQCAMAAEQFYAAELAPGVKGVPEEFISGQLAQYRKELESCMGQIVIACDPGDVQLTLNDSTLSCGESIDLEPGAYIVKGVNASSGIEIEIPVQVLSGQTTRTQIKIPGKAPDDDKSTSTPVKPDPVESPPEPVGMTWRLTPLIGLGTSINVIERTSAQVMFTDNSAARYPHYGDRALMVVLGVKGRVLWPTSSLRYGVGAEARYERGFLGNLDGNELEVFVDQGFKLALHPQLWFSDYLGVFLGGVVRGRTLFVDEVRDDEDNIIIGDWASLGAGLGGGVKAELGELVGMRSLELSLGWLQPLSGEAGRLYREMPPGDEPRNAVPALEALIRAQFNRLTISLGWEGWYAHVMNEAEEDTMDNLRTTQFMLGLGWTFGSSK